MSALTEPKFLTRLLCIFLSIAINVTLLIAAIYRIFCKKQMSFNVCLCLLLSYLTFGIITPFYNIYYRFIIVPSQCFISDSIEEGLVIFTRLIILFFYISRLKNVFKGSLYEIDNKILVLLSIFIVSYSIIIPIIWIPQQKITPYITDKLGVYCSNTADLRIICIYYALDFIVTTTLCILFVRKLLAVRSKTNDMKMVPEHSDSTQESNENAQLTKLAKKTVILTTISIISSWIIMYPSYLSTTHFLKQLRWFYPLDYGINGLCLFLMFEWNIFDCYKSDESISSNNNHNIDENINDTENEWILQTGNDIVNNNKNKNIDIHIKENKDCIENKNNCNQNLKHSMQIKSRPSIPI